MTQGCVGRRDDLAAFVLGALDREERASMERHLATCSRCRACCEELVPVRDWLARTRRHLATCLACSAYYEDLLRPGAAR
jgi:anti-sigma factor RsiW